MFSDKVLLTENNGVVSIGTPILKNTTVTAEILAHLKGDKVVVFKTFIFLIIIYLAYSFLASIQ